MEFLENEIKELLKDPVMLAGVLLYKAIKPFAVKQLGLDDHKQHSLLQHIPQHEQYPQSYPHYLQEHITPPQNITHPHPTPRPYLMPHDGQQKPE